MLHIFKNSKRQIEDNKRNNSNQIYQFIFILSAIGLIGIVIYSINNNRALLWIGSSLIIGLATFMGGGIIGFLFGIPKLNSKYAKKEEEEYVTNTSLEEIADWLTKIIIGLGLTQLIKIPNYMKSLSNNIVFGIVGEQGDLPSDTTYILFLVIYYSLIGFFFAYFYARFELKDGLVSSKIYNEEKNKTDSLTERLNSKIENEKEMLTNNIPGLKKLLTAYQKDVLKQILKSENKTFRSELMPSFSEFNQLNELVKLGVIKLCNPKTTVYELTQEYSNLQQSDFE